MPTIIVTILNSHRFLILARIMLTFVFWTSGLAKLIDFTESSAEMESFGLSPGWLINTLTLLLQIGASLLIIFNRWTWLAAGALAIFTILTIPIAHPFWSKEGAEAFLDITVALEHVSVIGGLAIAAILSLHPIRKYQ